VNQPLRLRPLVHFTVSRGWTNDPYGVRSVNGEYHMFFQHVPHSTQWSPECHWGQAVSPDLIRWTETGTALTPEPDEIGCWSGSCVVDETGPVLLYTRIATDDWGRGQVALARATRGMMEWKRQPVAPVISGPPEGQPIVAFRDPFVWRTGAGWRAVLGAGLVGMGGCAIQYSSSDLENWTLDGILAARSGAERDPEWTGMVWECPQLFELDGTWVLLVSVWENDKLYHVAYALGDYDGHQFQPRKWGRFSYGPELYATTAFTDDQGRRCAMSWMRERNNTAPENSPWASAMSLPHILTIDHDRLVVGQHPALDAYFADVRRHVDVAHRVNVDLGEVGLLWRFTARIAISAGGHLELRVDHHGEHSWALEINGMRLIVTEPAADAPLIEMSLTGDVGLLDIVVDTDILEVTWSGGSGIAATRIPANPRAELVITADEQVQVDDVEISGPQ